MNPNVREHFRFNPLSAKLLSEIVSCTKALQPLQVTSVSCGVYSTLALKLTLNMYTRHDADNIFERVENLRQT